MRRRRSRRIDGERRVTRFVEKLLDASRQPGPDILPFGYASPLAGGGHSSSVSAEPDQPGVVAVPFADKLTQRQLTVGRHFRRPSITDMRVVRPHNDSRWRVLSWPSKWASNASSVWAMCWSRRFHDVTRPPNIAR